MPSKKIYNLSYSVYEHGTTDIADLSRMYASACHI